MILILFFGEYLIIESQSLDVRYLKILTLYNGAFVLVYCPNRASKVRQTPVAPSVRTHPQGCHFANFLVVSILRGARPQGPS